MLSRRQVPAVHGDGAADLVEDGAELRVGELAAPVRLEDLGAAVALQSFDEGLCVRSGHRGCWIIQNRDRHTLGDALFVLNPLAICLRYWVHLEATSQKTT